MPRFYVDPAAGDVITGRTVRISSPLLHHLRDVLRYRPHDTLPLFDARGRQYTVKIQRVAREAITAEVLEESPAPARGLEITLGVGIIKGPRMDGLIEKATELGVSRLAPLLTRRTVVRASGEMRLKQQRRWQRIALAAAQQAETGRVPVIDRPETFEAFVKAESAGGGEADLKVIFWEAPDQQRQPLRAVCRESRPTQAIGLVGPEGGFTPEEVAAARTHGFTAVTLGRRILKTETAALVALTLLQYELGALE